MLPLLHLARYRKPDGDLSNKRAIIFTHARTLRRDHDKMIPCAEHNFSVR